MSEAGYQNIEPWMYSAVEKFWSGQTWKQSIGSDIEKLTNPQIHSPYSIGKVLTTEQCSYCRKSRVKKKVFR